MYTAYLRKVGGSIMLAVPPAVLEMLDLKAGEIVGVVVDSNRLIIEPKPRLRYTLDELLSQCDASKPLSTEDRKWLDTGPVGRELL